MKQLNYVLSNDKEVFSFLKNHYPVYHLSNIFFRDVQFGIQKMFEEREERVNYKQAEKIARAFVEKLEKQKILNRIDTQSWAVNYPDYKTVSRKPAAPAKPEASAKPVPSAAVGGAKPSLPPLSGAKPALPPLGSAIPAGAKPALPPLSSAKPAGAKSVLPPIASAKPAEEKPALPPLTSAKPVGAKPSLPPLTSAKPAGAATPVQAKVEEKLDAVQPESPKQAPDVKSESAPAPSGEKKALPPLKGNYKASEKK
jgi:hypothetical protein